MPPAKHLEGYPSCKVAKNLPNDQIAFQTHFMVPQGFVSGIRFAIFINPEAYFSLPSAAKRKELSGVIGQLNAALTDQRFICVGPGRWGTLNTDLGVYVSYADICNAEALVELAGRGIGPAPEPSLGTHFFQDLMEAQIFPLAICVDHPDTIFNREFFYNTPNSLSALLSRQDWIASDDLLTQSIHLIDVSAFRPGHHLDLAMDDEQGLAMAYFMPDT